MSLNRAIYDIFRLYPVPRGIRAHAAIPSGTYVRQWDTLGRLWVWVNAYDLADLPHRAGPYLAPGDFLGLERILGLDIYDG